jgi:imidazolonepropionase-like amidohydrolase
MKKLVLALTLLATPAFAQNVVITNARVIDGTGRVVERGSVVVRDGKIVEVAAAVAAGNQAAAGAPVIDAKGMTVMPGFIDAHRHVIRGEGQQWLKQEAAARMQEYLESGFTTVLSAIDDPAILELRRRSSAGELTAPRIFAAQLILLSRPAAPPAARGAGAGRGGDPARFDTSRPPRRPTEAAGKIPPEEIVKAVDGAAKAGFDYLKTIITVTPGGPEVETLKLIVEEGRKRNIPTITHAVSVIDTLAAVEARPAMLVHTPHIGRLEEDPKAVQAIAKAGIPMTSTLAVFVPHFGDDNTPLFRDAQPFPWDTISSAGQGAVNARLLWEAGISYGYGTDTSWHPRVSLADELRALRLTFSPRDVVTILTKNAAASVLKSDQIGTLEPGKLADITVLDGNPLVDSNALLNVRMVLKGGRVVVNKR